MNLPDTSAATYASAINTGDLDTLIPHHTDSGQRYSRIKTGLAAGDRDLVERAAATLTSGGENIYGTRQSGYPVCRLILRVIPKLVA